jgi:uncharacterized protein (TIGR00251 family)
LSEGPQPSPFAAADKGLAVAVRLTPRAGRNRVEGVAADAAGRPVLKVAVTEAPEKGRANAALIKLLAKEWRIPKSALSIASGAGERRKTLLIEGDSSALMKQLLEWTGERHG